MIESKHETIHVKMNSAYRFIFMLIITITISSNVIGA